MPKISIIIPNYNQAQFVASAIQSVLNQTYRSFEIIVIDDGSTDNSYEVIEQFGERVKYIWQENQGLGGARNTGIRAAKSEFIGLLDADDEWQPKYLEKMIALSERYPEADVYFSNAQYMDQDGQDLSQCVGSMGLNPNAFYTALLRANFLIPSTMMIRRSVILAAGLFENNIRAIHGCEDWDLWLRIASSHYFIGHPECLVRYRLHGNSLSANPRKMQEAVKAVVEKNFGADDGMYQNWSREKRRAYGGVYRYYLLTSVQRQNDWQNGAKYLTHALMVDPTLGEDRSLFYDLAWGTQPLGLRGTAVALNLVENARQIETMLASVFQPISGIQSKSLKRCTYGTSYFALGIAAYNVRKFSPSRYFLLRALYYRPDLCRDPRMAGNLVKSLIGVKGLEYLRRNWLHKG